VPTSPEQGAQRRPLAAAIEATRRHSRPPKSGANQPLVPRRTSPNPSPAKTRGELAGIGQPAPASRPGDYIANTKFFPGSLLEMVNSNSKTLWLILVNCVANHRKIIKMQGQFFWICGELFYKFCYYGLS
jgi:hypothetical protein